MSVRVIFRLSMPNVGSHNGQWSGQGRDYNIVRSVPQARVAELQLPRGFFHNFGDGWGAGVYASVMAKGEKRPKSARFYDFDWMVDRIIRWGDTQCRHEWFDDPKSGQPGFEGKWIRCRLCQEGHREQVQKELGK